MLEEQAKLAYRRRFSELREELKEAKELGTIRAVLDRIAEIEATLGNIFSRLIKTCTFCSYYPDPRFSIAREFAPTAIERTEPSK
jgi:hypothetical protein